MVSTLMKKVHLQIKKVLGCQLIGIRGCSVEWIIILLHILKEGSEEHGEMQAVNHFSLCLLKDLKAIVNGAIQSGKIQ